MLLRSLSKLSIKVISSLLLITLFLFPTNAHAELLSKSNILLQINGSYVLYGYQGLPFQDQNYRTLLPVRMIGDLFGASITWNNADRSTTIAFKDSTATVRIGSSMAEVNGVPYDLGTKAVIKNNATVIPIRLIADMLNIKVDWDQKTRKVSISDERFLTDRIFQHMKDARYNLDESFENMLVPRSMTYTIDKEAGAIELSIDVINTSDSEIGMYEVHRNAMLYRSPDTSAGSGTYGSSAFGHLTGLNTTVLESGDAIKDTFGFGGDVSVSKNPVITNELGTAKYLVVNYFKTTTPQ